MKKLMKALLAVALVVSGLTLAACSKQASANKSSNDTHLVMANQKVGADTTYVSAKWAKNYMDHHKASTVVLEASYGAGKDFKKEHISESFHFDTMNVESEATNWNLLPVDQLEKNFMTYGVKSDSTLIIYSTDIDAASRVAFAAYYLGVKNVKVIDGGLEQWRKAGYNVQSGSANPKAAADFGKSVPGRPEALISTSSDLKAAEAKNPKLVLASVRAWNEFVGETSGYSYIKDAGEPKGAVWAKASKSSADVAYLTNSDGTLKNPTDIFKSWKSWGITADKEVAFYCGTGWRATTAFFIARQSGWKDVKMFDGGWYDWDKAHQKEPKEYPVQIGNPKDKKNFKIEY